jgi:hypothetical protein
MELNHLLRALVVQIGKEHAMKPRETKPTNGATGKYRTS